MSYHEGPGARMSTTVGQAHAMGLVLTIARYSPFPNGDLSGDALVGFEPSAPRDTWRLVRRPSSDASR